MTTVETIRQYLNSGLSVFPADPKKKTPRVSSWSEFQKNRPTTNQINEWFSNGSDSAPAICTGAVSGNLEILDFDEKARQFGFWKELVTEQEPDLVDSLLLQKTQNGGLHVIYRCADTIIPGNQKLSTGVVPVSGEGEHVVDGKKYKAIKYRNKWVVAPTLIETRGQGGYFLASPGNGYSLVQGDFVHIPTISTKQRNVLIDTAKAITEYIQETPVYRTPTETGSRPGDEFNVDVSITDLISEDGWKYTGRHKSMPDGTPCTFWSRPGKDKGISATVFDNKVYVFSTNAPPLENGKAYDPFAYLTVMKHYGSFRDAAIDLTNKGYGLKADESSRKRMKAVESNGKQMKAVRKPFESKDQNLESGFIQQEVHSEKLQENFTSLNQAIIAYVSEHTGTFRVSDIDRDLGIVTRADKNARSCALNRLEKAVKVKKIAGKFGYWKTISGNVDVMKLEEKEIKPLKIRLPLGLHELANLYPGNIILIAGAPNAGKTAFLMNILYDGIKDATRVRDNTKKQKNRSIHYLNSEMDENELVHRCNSFKDGSLFFKAVEAGGLKFIKRTRDFEDVLNPYGVNFIDFLEIHEDFFELGKLINAIFETLKGGICFIAVQKKQGAEYAKGGFSSTEKARLAINLDRNDPHGNICKIVKCKHTAKMGDSHDGKEIDFISPNGCEFKKLSSWRYVNEVQRRSINKSYENHGIKEIKEPRKKDDVYECSIRLVNSDYVHVTDASIKKWEKSLININVKAELRRIADDSENKPFLKKTGWFHQLAGILINKNGGQRQPRQA